MNVSDLNFKFESNRENWKKSRSFGILKFKGWSKNIVENMLQKIFYLETVILDISPLWP